MCSRTLEKNIKLFLFRYISRALRRDPLRHERIAERTYSSHTVVVACDAASGRCNVHGDASLAMLGVKFRGTQYPHPKKPARSRKIWYNIPHAKHLPPYQLHL